MAAVVRIKKWTIDCEWVEKVEKKKQEKKKNSLKIVMRKLERKRQTENFYKIQMDFVWNDVEVFFPWTILLQLIIYNVRICV